MSEADLPGAEAAGGPGPSRGPEPGPAELAKVAGSMWLHSAEWAAQSSAKLGLRVVQAAFSPSEAMSLLGDAQKTASGVARGLFGGGDLEDRVRDMPSTGVGQAVASAVKPVTDRFDTSTKQPMTDADALRVRGEHLLHQSRDVRHDEPAHPAYIRILDELAPDEGRILRLLLLSGPQPSVDVRTGGPIGMLSSELIAPGLSMIGPRAGLRYVDRVPSYLNNLFRLGMVWFSREQLPDSHRYQVIEAQPDVLEAMHSVRFPKIIRRSIHLTPFGVDFCRDCLALETETAVETPHHSDPGIDAVAPPQE